MPRSAWFLSDSLRGPRKIRRNEQAKTSELPADCLDASMEQVLQRSDIAGHGIGDAEPPEYALSHHAGCAVVVVRLARTQGVTGDNKHRCPLDDGAREDQTRITEPRAFHEANWIAAAEIQSGRDRN